MDEIIFYTTRMQGYLSALSHLTKDRVCFGTRSFFIDGDLQKAIVNDIKNINGSIIAQTKIGHTQQQ
jgi:acyl-CoA thioesterase